jgi:hypothetical protein
MTDDPIEQRQHDELLKGMSGHVLVGGLGLGYACAALSVKPRVRSITVVEISADVIKLVQPSLLRYQKQPIDVIQFDLMDFLRVTGRTFDCGFYDIWQSDGETTFHQTVVPLRQLSRGKVRDVRCWNEDIMRAQLHQGLWTRLQFLKVKNTQENNSSLTQQFIAHLHEHVDLDKLAEGNPSKPDDVWSNWAAPFWRWVRDRKPDPTMAEYGASWYVKLYGKSGHPDPAAKAIEILRTIA